MLVVSLLLLSDCEPHCEHNECAVLNGDLYSECGDCATDHACHRGAHGFRKETPWREEAPRTSPQLEVPVQTSPAESGDTPEATAPVSEHTNCPLYPLGVDRRAFEAEYCTGISERPGSGIVVLRRVIDDGELADMRALFDAIPYPTRYICGHSDDLYWTPDECQFDAEMLLESFPKLYARVREKIAKRPMLSREKGQHEMVRINNLQALRNSALPSMSYAKLEALMEQVEGNNGYQRQRLFTVATGVPFFSGLHWWHRDRQGRTDKLWLMVSRAGDPDSNETGLAVVPADAIERYLGPEGLTTSCLLDDQAFKPEMGSVLDELSCTMLVRPGDAVYYSNRVWHRSQDRKHDREALSMDVGSV